MELIIRSFIALEIPVVVQQQIRLIQERLGLNSLKFSWVNTENIHLTIKFLGNISTEKVSDIINILKRLAMGFKPFRLTLTEPDVFPNKRFPKVLWLGLKGDIEAVRHIKSSVEEEMEALLDFSRDDKPFNPHLTLARIRDIRIRDIKRDKPSFEQLLRDYKPIPIDPICFDRITLIKSKLTSRGAVYTPIEHIVFNSL